MKAIRGATTIERDTSEEIRTSVALLLNEIKDKNGLNENNIVYVIFSSTADIHSYYPAKAAREAGFFACPLFSVTEPQIDGGLALCIRVLVLAEIDSSPVHVYQKGAKVLRKDLSGHFNIALDGPAGSGKSTIAKIIAKRLNILYLDTGAMYRACALKCLKSGINTKDTTAIENVMRNIDLTVEYKDGEQKTFLDGEDVSKDIRDPEISMKASEISAFECVRVKMVELQRKIAAKTSCILDGRDIGSVVLPNAEFKFYLTARPEVRARRRTAENEQKGFESNYDAILKDIIKRDEQDRTRKFSPLVCAKDAIEVDSSEMSIEQVAAFIESKIQEKI